MNWCVLLRPYTYRESSVPATQLTSSTVEDQDRPQQEARSHSTEGGGKPTGEFKLDQKFDSCAVSRES